MSVAIRAADYQGGFDMKYLFALIGDESDWSDRSPDEQQAAMKAWDEFTQDTIDSGVHLGGEGLQPSSTATTLRVTEGDPVITDGPFAETKEQLGGYYLLDCKDLDEAIRWGKKVPLGPGSSIEIRPVMDYEAAGSSVHTSEAAGTA
jgi:hypothetical protein